MKVTLELIGMELKSLDTIEPSFIGKVKSKLKTKVEDINIDALKGKSRLSLYSTLKINFGRERYLELVKNMSFRKAITKVRLSDHNFDIEKGRKNNIERQNRVCQLCQSGSIGTEFHVVMQCSQRELVDIRKRSMEMLYSMNSTFKKLDQEQVFRYCLLANDHKI